MVESMVRDGVFFSRPTDLPRGRHQLARAEVAQRQRERLLISVTELVAENGFRAVGVRAIAGRAGVSQSAFYECFADKDECVFAAYDRFITVLLDRVTAAAAAETSNWPDTVAAVVEAYLQALQDDLVVARAFQVEMDALGRPARERRRNALVGMAQALKSLREERWPTDGRMALSAYVGAVYAVRQLASDALDIPGSPDQTEQKEQADQTDQTEQTEQAEQVDLVGLVGEVTGWVSQMLASAVSPDEDR